jgi:hypothetical protein
MDDFNPYRTPGSLSTTETLPGSTAQGWLYRLVNRLYVLLMVLATLILVTGNPQILTDTRAPLVLLMFYAPVLCYLLVGRGTPRLVRFGLSLQALLVLWLIYRYLDHLLIASPQLRIGSFLLAVNLLALLGGLRQAKLKSFAKEHA